MQETRNGKANGKTTQLFPPFCSYCSSFFGRSSMAIVASSEFEQPFNDCALFLIIHIHTVCVGLFWFMHELRFLNMMFWTYNQMKTKQNVCAHGLSASARCTTMMKQIRKVYKQWIDIQIYFWTGIRIAFFISLCANTISSTCIDLLCMCGVVVFHWFLS